MEEIIKSVDITETTNSTAEAVSEVLALDPGVQNLLIVVLAFIMLSVSLSLKSADFDFIKKHPTSILIGSIAQLLGLPLLTLLLIFIIVPSPGAALGMIVIACCPGGNVSNLLTRISNSDAAYSVALTSVSSVFAAIMLPFAILFWTGLYGPTADLLQEINIDRADFIIKTGITLAIPVATGLLAAYRWPTIASKLAKILVPISIFLIVTVIALGVKANLGVLLGSGAILLPIVIIHNVTAFGLGYITGYFGLRDKRKARALTFEVGIQNAGLGLLIVLSQLGGVGDAALIVALWSLWHLIAGLLLVGIFRLGDKWRESPNAAA
ncbi:MAG: bile acid:sodium symporter [Kordiimonadaceae bacterium]|nr:bile acid:sodium symporter [Kordiimonadaceae bacterium]